MLEKKVIQNFWFPYVKGYS